MGQFEEHVAPAVGQREDLAAANSGQQVGLDPHVGPGKTRSGSRRPSRNRWKRTVAARIVSPSFLAWLPNWCGVATIVPIPSATAISAIARRIVPAGRTVIQPRQQVTMDIDERFGGVHGDAARVQGSGVRARG